jgi:hypothetical protein
VLRLIGRIAVSLLLAAPVARAQPEPGGEADRLFEEGRALARDGKYAEACDRFARSFELDRTTGTELNLADCHEKLGHLSEAWRLFSAAADEAQRTGNSKRGAFARGRADALVAKLATVVIRVADPTRAGLAITIGGRPVPPRAEIQDRFDPGELEIVATAPGRPRFATTVEGAAGATVVVDLPASADRTGPAQPVEQRRSRGRVRLAWGLAGAGGVAALASLGLTFVARRDYNATADGAHCMHVTGGIVCDDTGDADIRSSQRLADLGTGFAIGGGVVLAAAAVVYLTAPRTSPVTVAPTATATGVGLAVSRHF